MGAEWMDRAACRGADVDTFFPVGGRHIPTAARRYCDDCPVKQACLQWAIERDVDGVWGGTARYERRNRQSAGVTRSAVAGKTCTGCGEHKPLTEYYAHPHSRDGLTSQCKRCAAAAKRRRNRQKEMSST